MISFLKSAPFFLALFLTSCGKKEEPISDEPAQGADLVKEFSGDRAFAHVQALTDLGPRPPESDGYRKSLTYLEKELSALGWKTKRQDFKDETPIGPVNFTNLLARYTSGANVDWETSVPFVLGSHLDTKRYISITFLGANDSGSSTGVLVEMANVLPKNPTLAQQVELVFFDGEEAMLTNIDPKKDGLYGSRFYASELTKRKSQPQFGMVLDLVGDTNVPLLIGADSDDRLKRHAINAAMKLNLGNTTQVARYPIIDDHLPLITKANLKTLHLIGDFNRMPYWHTQDDTIANISPVALSNSGKLALQVITQLTKSH
ncbi:MAG: M28 family peptidase [Akkermansiaceae bacterium]